MAKSICFFNNKGGVGKTTLTCNLAAYLAKMHNKKVIVIDADPQCNSSQYILDNELYENILKNNTYSTLSDIIEPIEEGNLQTITDLKIVTSDKHRFYVDIIPGHPRVSLFEDKLSNSWITLNNDITSLRITNWVYRLNRYLDTKYDFIVYDVGPSLGALNRTILLGCEYFITPMGCDTFSIMGIKNIADWLKMWNKLYNINYEILCSSKKASVDKYKDEVLESLESSCKFIGYTVQQYITTRKSKGIKRPTKAFETIINEIPQCINDNLGQWMPNDLSIEEANLGDVPHLYSLVPLAQKSNVPIFSLEYKDGLVGSQYNQLEDYKKMLDDITKGILRNINGREEN